MMARQAPDPRGPGSRPWGPQPPPARGIPDGAIVGLLEQHVGNETSDPKKVAQVVLKLAYHDQPPVHLLLGSDALHYAGEAEKARAASGEAWREVSVATDYAAPATLPNFPQS